MFARRRPQTFSVCQDTTLNSSCIKDYLYETRDFTTIRNLNITVYIGSTCEPSLSRRMVKHRSSHQKYGRGNVRYASSSHDLLQCDDCKIVLVENYPCNNKDELRARERYWFDQTQEKVNKIRPRTTKEDITTDAKIR